MKAHRGVPAMMVWLAAIPLAGLALLSCNDGLTGPSDLDEIDPLAVVVTEPVVVVFGGHSSEPESAFGMSSVASLAGAGEVSFVSYAPGSNPEADSIEVYNVERGLLVGARMIDGGVDPISIPASVGENLLITMFSDGFSLRTEEKTVPDGSPPRVVRTNPPRRRARIPLNASMLVVFTEPITAASATSQNIQLLDGNQPVPISVIRSWDGTSVQIIPDQPLQHSTTYTISVTTGVRDLSGEEFQQPFASEFTTIASGAQLVGAIVFESRRSGRGEVWVMNSDGTDPFQLTREVARGVCTGPALSPDGRKVTFSVQPAGGSWEIYVINVDGTGLTNLTNHPAWDGWRPAWSPDGSKIAFFSTRDDPANDEIYVMNADGTGVTRLTDNPSDDANPTWSPDGSRVAFETNRDGDYDIYVMNADGTNPVPLTTHPADDGWPAWSPDGSKIAFDSWRDGNREIYVMEADGSNVVRLTNHEGQDSAPAWSRNGTKIAFVSDRSGSTDLWVINSDGTGLERLTDHPAADFFPSWSQ